MDQCDENSVDLDNEDDSLSENSDVIIEEEQTKVTAKEAVEAFKKVSIWAEENIDDLDDLTVLRKIQQIAIMKSIQNPTQKKISDFFQ